MSSLESSESIVAVESQVSGCHRTNTASVQSVSAGGGSLGSRGHRCRRTMRKPNKYEVQARRQKLDDIVRRRSWPSFVDEFKTIPDENGILEKVVLRRTGHRTLLHDLCSIGLSRPPPEVVILVARVCPKALDPAPNSSSALHLALKNLSALEVVAAMVELVGEKQRLLMSLDRDGRTPLDLAVSRECHEDIITYLVDQDEDGSTLLNNWADSRIPLRCISKSLEFSDWETVTEIDVLFKFVLIKTYRAKMRKQFVSRDIKDEEICLLQALVLCQHQLGSKSSSILSHIIRNGLFKHRWLDIMGNSTLHYACFSETKHYCQLLKLGIRSSDCGLNSEDGDLVQFLLRTDPEACSIKNRESNLPLHCALSSGKHMSHIEALLNACPESIRIKDGSGECPLHLAIRSQRNPSDIKRIWGLYPEESAISSASSHLFPFQLAAVRKNDETNMNRRVKCKRRNKKKKPPNGKEDQVQENNWDSMTLSYFLLRECPSVMDRYIIT